MFIEHAKDALKTCFNVGVESQFATFYVLKKSKNLS